MQTTTVAVQDGETHSHDGKTFDHKLTSVDGKLYIDNELQTAGDFGYVLSISESDGCYYLDDNLTLDKPLSISTIARGGVVNLCLNSHSITLNSDGDVIVIDPSTQATSFKLYDCSKTNAGLITHAADKTGSGVKFYGAGGNVFHMYGGTISNNQATENGGGVVMMNNNNGRFYLHDGVITHNKAQNGGGVAIIGNGYKYENSVTFTMSGGTISDNEAISSTDGGGGVYLDNNSTFTMTGGTISGNMANSGLNFGGGVYLADGTFTMTGGTITKNEAPKDYGGGVYLHKGSFTMTGGEITENIALLGGGGIGTGVNETTSINVGGNAKITGNSAPCGAGIFVSFRSSLTMTGGTVSNNEAKKVTDEELSGTTCNGGGVFLGGTMTVSGSPNITGNKKDNKANNVFFSQHISNDDYYTMTIGSGGLTSGASIGVTSSKELSDGDSVTIVSSGAASDSEKYFSADAGEPLKVVRDRTELLLVNGTLTHKHPICGKTCTHNGVHSDVTWTAINGATALQNATGGSSAETTKYYYLTDNVSLDTTWTPSGYLALDLNGYTLDTKQNINIIQLDSDTNLTLTSCFDGGTVRHEDDANGRGVVVASGATFTMHNVELTNNGTFDFNNDANSGGGSVLVKDGSTFNMYSGTISDGEAYLGGGVSVVEKSTFNMYGGTISGNKVNDPTTIYGDGGGVYVYKSTFNMTGGEIKNNVSVKPQVGLKRRNPTAIMG